MGTTTGVLARLIIDDKPDASVPKLDDFKDDEKPNEDGVKKTKEEKYEQAFKERFVVRTIDEYDLSFSMPIDKDNQPCGIPRGGKIKIKAQANKEDQNPFFLNWMKSRTLYSGKIELNNPTKPDATLTNIKFENACLVDYKQSWKCDKASTKKVFSFSTKGEASYDSVSTYTPTFSETFEIAWKCFDMDGVTYENDWT